jgi:CPA2 family monovalent cation:H+ antiporter-2
VQPAHEFLKALAIVLGVAGVTTVVFQLLRQPVVLGYILAGLLVGPHVPVPLVADPVIVKTLSEVGVILLMFSLGLEFSVRQVARVMPTAGVAAVIETSVMMWLGFLAGRAFGWTTLESVFAGALICISSTTIVARAFKELGVGGRLRELVYGVLIVEDLIAVLLMAGLTAVATGSGLSSGELGAAIGKLALFLAALLAGGIVVVPRAVRALLRLGRNETIVIACLALCFAIALLARAAGYSVALGAFIAGSLVAESGEGRRIERLIMPVRDLFAAVFFVSVGMLVDPALVTRHWQAIAAFTALTVVGKIAGVSVGAFVTGSGMRTSVQAGMSLAQIGEFSFIIAGLGAVLGATGPFLYALAATVSSVTTLFTPWLIRASGRAAALLDRKLPPSLQTVLALYGSWIEQMRAAPARKTAGGQARRLARALAIDAFLLVAVVIGAALGADRGAAAIERALVLPHRFARGAVVAAVALACAPLVLGLFWNARRMGVALARLALPQHDPRRTDLAAAPRRAFVVTLQFAIIVLVALPIAAMTQPFLPGVPVAALLGAAVAVLAIAIWRSAANLQGHVRAGAQVVVEALAGKARTAEPDEPDPLAAVRELFPGLGEPVTVRLQQGSFAAGRSLAELNLRGVTGATVIAIQREGGGVMIPSAGEVLRAGDVLAVAGAQEAVAAARAVLCAPGAGPEGRGGARGAGDGRRPRP